MTQRAAVVGLGAMGRHHVRVAAQTAGVELVAACDVDAARAGEQAAAWSCRAVTSPADLPRDLQAVVIATPTVTHRAIAEPLLRAGVSCLVEKPLAASLADADAMIAAAEAGRAVLAVGHAERFNPGLLRVLDRIHAPEFVEAHRLGGFPARSLDVDVVLDLMVHDLDLLLWLTGGDVIDVQAIGVGVLTDSVDIANARLLFSTGCTANITASRVSAEPTRKLRLFQGDSYVSIDLRAHAADVLRLDRSQLDELGRPRIHAETLTLAKGENPPEPLRLEHDAFFARAAGGVEAGPGSLATGAEGRRALAAALMVLEAMAAHRERATALRRSAADASHGAAENRGNVARGTEPSGSPAR